MTYRILCSSPDRNAADISVPIIVFPRMSVSYRANIHKSFLIIGVIFLESRDSLSLSLSLIKKEPLIKYISVRNDLSLYILHVVF